MNKIKQFFIERYFSHPGTVYEMFFETLFYILGWSAVIVLLSLHFAVSHFTGLSLDISELVWILSIPASFSSLGQYIGRAAGSLFPSPQKPINGKMQPPPKNTNERIASLVGLFLSVGLVTAAVHFNCDDASFVSSSSTTMGWEYGVATLPLMANAIIASCGYAGRIVDYFTQTKTIVNLVQWVRNKILGEPTDPSRNPFENVPLVPKETVGYFKSCFKDHESTCRTVGFVLGITLGVVLVATGTALLPFGGSGVVLHVLACALFVFLSGRTFSAMGKYVGKATDCMLEKDQKKRPVNEQIFSLIGLGVGLAVSVVLAPLHKLGASMLVNKLADKAAAYVTLGIPVMMSTVAAGFAYAGKFIDNLTNRKTYIDVLEDTKLGKAVRNGLGWLKNKIFGSKPQPVTQKTEGIVSPALSKLGGSRDTSPSTREKTLGDNQSDALSYNPVLQPAPGNVALPIERDLSKEKDLQLECGVVCTP